MEFDWDIILWLGLVVGILPFLVVRLRKIWKWYHKIQSGSSETLKEHVARIEKEEKRK